MVQSEWLVELFEEHRPRLRSVAYRMLGSLGETDDALQEAWIRISGAGAQELENPAGWLTTVVARVCLNRLRSRRRTLEDPGGTHVPDPVVSMEPASPVEEQALLSESVSLALLVVLDALGPAERLAFVLHDIFGLPFDDIAPLVERKPAAVRQLASRARRKVQGAPLGNRDTSLHEQRAVVDAFFRAVRDGRFDALVALLDPKVTLRIDAGVRCPPSVCVTGAQAVADHAARGLRPVLTRPAADLRPVVVNGQAGVVAALADRPMAIIAFSVRDDRILHINAIAEAERVTGLLSGINRAGD